MVVYMKDERIHQFFKALGRIKKATHLLIAHEQLNFNEHRTLSIIRHGLDLNLTEELNINKSAVSQMLSGLESKGFIVREINTQDRRKLDIHLTDAAHKLMDEIEFNGNQIMSEIFGEFGEQRTNELLSLFEEFAEVVEATPERQSSKIKEKG